MIRVKRSVVDALRSASEEQSILVVGVPGAGKSGALHDYAQSLVDEGRGVICVAADRVASRTLGELRNELGLEHEILDVIDNWPLIGVGFWLLTLWMAAAEIRQGQRF
jgi:KaiC/GvpD/RAD55 family RecA-like ATPase